MIVESIKILEFVQMVPIRHYNWKIVGNYYVSVILKKMYMLICDFSNQTYYLFTLSIKITNIFDLFIGHTNIKICEKGYF